MKYDKIKKDTFMNNNAIKFYEVFVPGGFPTYTYNPRDERKLQEMIAAARENLSKLMIVTGPTKSGKTVLVKKVYPYADSVWIDGGTITNEDMFWESVVEKLDGYTESSLGYAENEQLSMAIATSVSGGIKIVSAEGKTETTNGKSSETSRIRTRNISNKVKAIEILNSEKIALIIDDFHYIPKDIQKNIIRALKAPIMNGLPVICIAIPSRKFDVINVEREMTGRIEPVNMPEWTNSELYLIANQGFKTLNVKIPESTINTFVKEAQGSPFLVQEFCKAFCKRNGIEKQSEKCQEIKGTSEHLVDIFINVAENSGRSMFKKLENGPRARTDRKIRKLKDGTETDIYGLVMAALKHIKPTETIKYDQLRTAIKEISTDEPPQRGEVSRILEKIAEISYTDSSSTPVIDWQKEDDLLTITDPFFAFFLRWTKS